MDDIRPAIQSCQDPTGIPLWSLWKDTSLFKPEGSQWKSKLFIKTTMLKQDVLDLNDTTNTITKLCELAAQRNPSLTPFIRAIEVTCPVTRQRMLPQQQYNIRYKKSTVQHNFLS
jgi:hypothetical protein